MGPHKIKTYGQAILAALKGDAASGEPRYVDEE
jgi:hypothetical protein